MTTPEWLIPALEAMPDVRWSICLQDASHRTLLAWDAEQVLPTASVGKVLLLLGASLMIGRGGLEVGQPLLRDPGLEVGDSGLWQHLAVDRLAVADLAVLVGAVSDNWATNVLLEPVAGAGPLPRIGNDQGTALHDRVRDHRGPEHPATLSTGSAGALAGLMVQLALDDWRAPGVGDRVLGWLRLNTDLSMVASAFGLDPLAHGTPDLGLLLANKTGTDAGVRADVGVVVPAPDGEPDPARAVGYAVLAQWAPDLPADRERRTRLAVLALMRRLGEHLDALVRA